MPEDARRIALPDIVPMDLFVRSEPISIDLVYANPLHPENIFKTALYHSAARLSLHIDLCRTCILTARTLYKNQKWILVLKDGLRTIEAQQKMMDTDIVKENPQWLMEPRMLSGPGMGGHPRGMAVDVSVCDTNGQPVDMGTLFDTMTPESARNYAGISKIVQKNRAVLESAFMDSAKSLNLPLLPLPSEWWDFRFPASYSQNFEPLSDKELPRSLQMTRQDSHIPAPDEEKLANDVLQSL